VGRHWTETHWLNCRVVWSGRACPTALAYQPLTTTTTPPRIEAVASKHEPSMQANQVTRKEDTEATKEHINSQVQRHDRWLQILLYIFISLTYMILGPYLSGSAKFFYAAISVRRPHYYIPYD
jgi:hypothetical protein